MSKRALGTFRDAPSAGGAESGGWKSCVKGVGNCRGHSADSSKIISEIKLLASSWKSGIQFLATLFHAPFSAPTNPERGWEIKVENGDYVSRRPAGRVFFLFLSFFLLLSLLLPRQKEEISYLSQTRRRGKAGVALFNKQPDYSARRRMQNVGPRGSVQSVRVRVHK